MTKFASFNEDGTPRAFYAEDVHGHRLLPVYSETVEPTEEEPDPAPPSVTGHIPNPNTSIPLDAVEITDEQWMEFISNQGLRRWEDGEVVAFEPPTPELTEDDYRRLIQELVDSHAKSRRYDNGNSMATYVTSTVPAWAAEAQAFVAWRDAVWAKVYELQTLAMNGDIQTPSIEETMGALPDIVWPEQAEEDGEI